MCSSRVVLKNVSDKWKQAEKAVSDKFKSAMDPKKLRLMEQRHNEQLKKKQEDLMKLFQKN